MHVIIGINQGHWLMRSIIIRRIEGSVIFRSVQPTWSLTRRGYHIQWKMVDHIKKVETRRVFWHQIHFTPLVWRLGGQVGGLKKQDSSRNSIFQFSAAVFQPELRKLQKRPKFSQIVSFWDGSLKNSLMNFASLDTQFDPQVKRLVEVYPAFHFSLQLPPVYPQLPLGPLV